MGRHAEPAHALPGRSPFLLIVPAVLAVVLVAGGLVWWLAGSEDQDADACGTTRTVAVAVAPEVAELTADLLADPIEMGDGECAAADVTGQRPLQTVGNLAALGGDALPDVWVPDSSLWPARVTDVPLDSSGSMATSPIVLATSRAAVGELGWTEQAPDWSAALTADRPLAVGDVATSAAALSALAAVRESLGGGGDADTTVVRGVLAAARGPAVSPEAALAAASQGAADVPLVPASEQEVVTANRDVAEPSLVAVYPAEGSPVLDYPVVRVGEQSGQLRPAVDAVVRRLTSQTARDAVARAGFRGADGAAFEGAGEATGTREEVPETLGVDPAAAQELLARLASLAVPSRLLAVVDVSTSMEAPVGDGTRATLARDSAKSALQLFPPNTAIGLWFFAVELEGEQDWADVVPTRTLGTFVNGESQRDLLVEQLDSLPSRLTPGGTGLYDTTLAAVRTAQERYDADAVNSVVLITDGAEEDDDGLTINQLTNTLREEADPDRPVKVVGVALGPDADLGALERIAESTGGAAYSAVEETDLQEVLFDALRQRG
jgi:hypothetical protein